MSKNQNYFFDNSKYEDHSKNVTINVGSASSASNISDIMHNLFADAEDVPCEDVGDSNDPVIVGSPNSQQEDKETFRSYIFNPDIADSLMSELHRLIDHASDSRSKLMYLYSVRALFSKRPPFKAYSKEFLNGTDNRTEENNYSKFFPKDGSKDVPFRPDELKSAKQAFNL